MPEHLTDSHIIIKCEDLSVCHGDREILSGVNLELGMGSFHYLIGKVGSGKTSLLKVLYADLPVCEGSVMVAGFDLTKMKPKRIPKLRRKVGVVFQDFQLLTDRNVGKNLEFVLKATGWKSKRDIMRRIDEVLDRVDMVSSKEEMPYTLSGGEQQRVVIARALLNNPEILLADEPTGNLDPESAGNLIQILKKVQEGGQAVLMVTHNYDLIKRYPEKSLICEDGAIKVEEDSVESIKFEDLM